jgi:hypothetical protein
MINNFRSDNVCTQDVGIEADFHEFLSDFYQNWNVSIHLSKDLQQQLICKSFQRFWSCYIRMFIEATKRIFSSELTKEARTQITLSTPS